MMALCGLRIFRRLMRPCRRQRTRIIVLFFALVIVLSAILAFLQPEFSDQSFVFGVRHESGQWCVHPLLQVRARSLPYTPLTCHKAQANWVEVRNGTLHLTPEAQTAKATCRITPIVRGVDDFETLNGTPIENVTNKLPLVGDFFNAECRSADGRRYANLHSGIAHVKRVFLPPPPGATPPLNILMIGYDSMSRLSWIQNLPQSHDYFVRVLGGTVLEGYNIVGDGTPQALLPMLTGKNEEELPEARRGHENAQPVDDHPWIWKAAQERGYVTQYGEDSVNFGTFTYRMLGFERQPVDHYMRPFYARVEQQRWTHRPYCLGSQTRHANLLRWTADLFDMYERTPKFSFMFHGEYSHDSYTMAQLADAELLAHLKAMQRRRQLDNTMLVMFADHGPRYASMRRTVQGKYEERMPYFGLRFPASFASRHPAAMRSLRENVVRLTTPYDIHETLKEVLAGVGRGAPPATPGQRGYSLLRDIPKSRTCEQAGVQPHWCTCLRWQAAPVGSRSVLLAARALVAYINRLTAGERASCHELTLANVTSAVTYSPQDQLMRYMGSSDSDGRVAQLDESKRGAVTLYQIHVLTRPGGALYEATLSHVVASDTYTADRSEISRINKYDDQPKCIVDRLPILREYCYCRT